MLGLDIPRPFDLSKLCAAVSAHRGRSLVIEEVHGVNGADGELCGVWVELDTTDYVFIEASTSPLHRDHIALHEISHMLLGHTSTNEDAPRADLSHLFVALPPETVRSVLGRANFSSPQEREAEQLANRIARLAKLTPRQRSRNPELERLAAGLLGESA
ncbi:hypothetical protein [Streptomyces fragilis]|uniref:hypothetical protein n=1 Tax=Streptomyces fragilis TaxID=67301 RepID=UPI000D5982F4|nr:hypothetical protein [Streptomyces fragilis]